MGLKKTNFTEKLHCPHCNCMYIIIDNEIVSCPVCEVSSYNKPIIKCEENTSRDGISSITNLNFNKSSSS